MSLDPQPHRRTSDSYLADAPPGGYRPTSHHHSQQAPSMHSVQGDFAEPLNLPELDFSTGPPSYDAAISDGALNSMPSFDPSHGQHGHQLNEQPPYAPVDYPSQLAYDEVPPRTMSRMSGSGENMQGGSRRPTSDASQDLDAEFNNLRLTNASPVPGVQRQNTAPPAAFPSPYGGPSPLPPRARSTTGSSYNSNAAASVYSLDSGMSSYSAPQRNPYGSMSSGSSRMGLSGFTPMTPARPPPADNPYYSAANDFLGMPPPPQQNPVYPSQPGMPQGAPPGAVHQPPPRQASMTNLARTNTTRSTVSLSSVSSMPSIAPISESVGASSTRRRGGIDVSKPPYTREFVDDYRNRMKVDPDPEAQFAFAKYLIEAAKKIGDEMGARDARAGRKYRDSLLAESLRNIKKLAEGKEPYADAQFFLANLYGTGHLGLQVDHEKAYYLYLMASKLNHPAATYRAAVCCELGAGTKRDPQRAMLFYRKAAALGDTAAMYKLALILLNGIMGHPRNPREAHVWLRRAAAQADEDNPHALHELALLHERPNNGTNGVIPFDPNLAREYLTQAAQLGYAPAQFKMGSCHEFGNLGFPIDPRRSIAWYTRAAEKGDSEAELALSGWYLTGSEGVLKQSDTEAYLWGRKAANKNLAKAEYAVGYYTEMGIGVKQDIELAKRWYQRAASNKRAMQRLAELSQNVNRKGARPTRKDAESECSIM
ncbi:enzyme activator [Trichosporon asahii var. asahii CBS 2479]|uniref:Enzyme activator n=1 Tax=Trichosporon asahii var. asahii (strain ATCC 90039 / CBS 2479 / JCM 2466 / KCTC 7840 / NBRC 103889/ NCYC 2677 / UAMH 7654) TaxID=1186058 RepID=J4U8R6_TRIAS|nr:enzyme activator [Trichosporon asahii var. asahii CBS 2479]EJT46915.1 enzyme activator [Trichosporon asahii var. asahii CBS 2479]